MAAHWTYDDPDGTSLYQGDLLQRSAELLSILKEYHPYFESEAKYRHFMVLTQSCDLVVRSGKCKAGYLTIAAVRELQDVLLSKELQNITDGKAIGRIVSASAAGRIRDFLSRLANNNDPNYFFLRADNSQGLTADCCACLRVTVPLRVDHYAVLLRAKTGQLKEVFQAKLGWLVGNNYSRVGTPDWAEAQASLKAVIDAAVSSLSIVEDRKLSRTLKVIKEAGEALSEARVMELQSDPRTKVLKRAELFVRALQSVWPDDAVFPDKQEVVDALGNSDALSAALEAGLKQLQASGAEVTDETLVGQLATSSAFKEGLAEIINTCWPTSSPPAKKSKFLGRLQNVPDFSEALKEP